MPNDMPHAAPASGLRETLEEQRATAFDQIAAAWQLHVTRLEEQIASGWKENVEHVIEERFRETSARVQEAFAREMERRLAEARERIRRELGDRFNQLLRRLRKAETEAELRALALDGAAGFCRSAAFFVQDGDMLRCEGSRDFAAGGAGLPADTMIPASSAPALLNAIVGMDTVIATQTAAELSAQLAGFFGEAPERKAGVFPVVSRGKSVGVLCAAAGEGGLEAGALELIATLAGVALEARAPAAAPAEAAEAQPVEVKVVRLAASDAELAGIPPAERALHLRAQRFARARVAELRLYQAGKVREGRTRGDLYGALREEIESAREGYRAAFLNATPGLPDYLHAELVDTLAGGDPALLGPDYPGPLE
jgi:hypothetical protein